MRAYPRRHAISRGLLRLARVAILAVMAAALIGPMWPSSAGGDVGQGALRPVAAAGGDGAWVLLGPPPARHDHTAVWNPIMKQLLIFGGDLNDLWSYRPDRNSWAELHPAGGPPSVRRVHTAVWDDANSQMLVFGGTGAGGNLNDLWAYKPAGNTWTQLTPQGDLPPARWGHSAVWDRTNGQMLIFGGEGDGTPAYRNDLWSYRPATNTWTQLTPFNLSGAPPAARSGHVAVWDTIGRQMVVFSGATGPTTFPSDVWAYTPLTNAWVQKFATGVSPGGIWRSTAVWDSNANRMLVNTGSLWGYDPQLNHWAQISPASGGPSGRNAHAAAWDSNNGQLLMFGGVSDSVNLDDLWMYKQDNTWTQLYLTGAKRYGHTAVWDSTNRQMLIFGGLDNTNYLNDLWRYQPATSTWTKLTPSGGLPPARYMHSAVWDAVGGQMLVFGGYNNSSCCNNDLWTYRPAANAWTQLTPAAGAPVPPVRYKHSAVWDAADGQMLIFGGYQGSSSCLGDLWAYRPAANAWTQLTPADGTAVPSARSGHSAVWDAAGGQMLVFGGYTGSFNSDLWTYRPAANAWTQLTPAAGTPVPPARYGQSAVWDAVSGQMLVFGGYGSICCRLNDLWRYDPLANAWTQLAPTGSLPGGRYWHTGIWDPINGQMLVFGGYDSDSTLGGLWAYRPASGTTVRLRLDPAPVAGTLGAASPEVRIYAESGPQQLDGVQLRIAFDPAKLQVVDADPATAGVQITPGTAFLNTLDNRAGNSAGTIDLAVGRGASATPPSGSLLLGSFKVRGLAEGVWPLSFVSGSIEAASGGGPLPYTLDDGAVQVIPKHMVMTAQPVRGVHIRAPGVQPEITLKDGEGAVVADDNSTTVTLAIVAGTGAAGATLACDQTISGAPSMAAVQGVARFTGCVVDKPGAGYILEATAPGLTPVRTDPFNITWAGDTNADCRVSVLDYSLVVTHFGKTPEHADWTHPDKLAYRADVNGDLRVGALSFSIVVTRFVTETASCAPASDGNPYPGQ